MSLIQVIRTCSSEPQSSVLKKISKLIEEGADLSEVDHNGDTALHITVSCYCTFRVAKKLIDSGAEINAQAINGCTPLHLAIIYKKTQLIDLLIDEGASLIVKNSYNNTPIDLMRKKFSENYLRTYFRQLIEKKPDVKNLIVC